MRRYAPDPWQLSRAVGALVVVFYAVFRHRGLRSFPTRRSSDLDARQLLGDRAAAGADARSQGLAARRLRHRDRKSTRLNSSHVAISYAVFCLKKKNQLHFITQRVRTIENSTTARSRR